MKNYIISIGFLIFTCVLQAQTCNFSIQKTDITCNGLSNGSVAIYKNGSALSLLSTCITAPTATYNCASTVAGATILSQTSGDLQLSGGKVYYLTSSNFTGGINVGEGGAILVVCGTMNLTWMSQPNDNSTLKIEVNGTLNANNGLNVNAKHEITNYGTINASQISLEGKLTNNGTITVSNQINVNGNAASFINNKSISTVDFNVSNKQVFTNNATLTVTGNMGNNGSGSVNNNCSLNIGGTLTNDALFKNSGSVTVTGVYYQNSNKYEGNSGSSITVGSLMLDTEIKGVGTSCAALKVNGLTTINGSGWLRGNLGACFVGGLAQGSSSNNKETSVTTNCSCAISSQSIGTVTWSNGGNGASLSTLSAATYTATVNVSGCATQTLSATINNPTAIQASVALNAATKVATVTASGGTGALSYKWNDQNNYQTSNTRDLSQVANGTYCVTVKDVNSCSKQTGCVEINNTTTCGLTISKTDVSCFGAANGSAQILKDGQPLVLSNGSGNTGGTSSGASCAVPVAPLFSCSNIPSGASVVTQTSGDLTFSGGNTYYLTSNFSGSITFGTGGAKLIICGNSTFQNINRNENGAPVSIDVNGSLTVSMQNLNLNPNYTLTNYGTLTTNASGFDGGFYNHGSYFCSSTLNLNSSSSLFDNTGSIQVGESMLINMPVFKNRGYLNVNKSFHVNGSGKVENYCTILAGKEFQFNGVVDNYGLLHSQSEETKINGSSVVNNYSGALLKVASVFVGGQVKGLGTTCSKFQITNATNLTGALSGNLTLCLGTGTFTNNGTTATSVSTSCNSCNAVGTSNGTSNSGTSTGGITGTVTWNNGSTGTTLSNLSSGTYTATVSIAGCQTTTLTANISQPNIALAASTVLNNGTATVTASGGTLPYSYEWSDGVISASNVRNMTGLVAGSYCVTVKDANNCSATSQCLTIGSGACGATVIYNANNTASVSVLDCQHCKLIDPTTQALVCSLTVETDTPSEHDDKVRVINTETNAESTLEVDHTSDKACPQKPIVELINEVVYSNGKVRIEMQVTSSSNNGAGFVFVINDGKTTQTVESSDGHASFDQLPYGTYTVVAIDKYTNLVSCEFPLTVDKKNTETYTYTYNDDNTLTITAVDVAPNTTYTFKDNAGNTQIVVASNVTDEDKDGKLDDCIFTFPVGTFQKDPETGSLTITITNSNGDVQVLVINQKCTSSFVPSYQSIVNKTSTSNSSDGSIVISELSAGYTIWSKAVDATVYTPSSNGNITGLAAGKYHVELRADSPICVAKSLTFEVEEGKNTVTITETDTNQIEVCAKNEFGADMLVTKVEICNLLTKACSTQNFPIPTPCPNVTLVNQDGPVEIKATTVDASSTSTIFSPPTNSNPSSSTWSYTYSGPLCKGDKNGTITVNGLPQGASNFKWIDATLSPTSITNPVRTGLGVGNYQFEYKIASAYYTQSLSLDGTPVLDITFTPNIPAKSVTFSATGGKDPYSYKWSDLLDSPTTLTRANLVSGTEYTLKITDANNCSYTESFVFDPCGKNPIQAIITKVDDQYRASVSGGTAPYSYYWYRPYAAETNTSPAVSESTVLGVNISVNNAAGHSLYITDVNGCKESKEVASCTLIPQYTLTPTAASKLDVCDGKAVLSLPSNSDKNKYTILWDKKNIDDLLENEGLKALRAQSDIQFINACAGLHKIWVYNEDLAGCAYEKSFEIEGGEITEPPCINGNIPAISGLNTSYTLPCDGTLAENISFNVSGGKKAYTYLWTYQAVGSTISETFTGYQPGFNGDNLKIGTYTLKVKDANKCESTTKTFTVSGVSKPLAVSHQITLPKCKGQNASVALIITDGASGNPTIKWYKNDVLLSNVSDLLTDNEDGARYQYVVSKGNCSSVGGEFVLELPSFEASFTSTNSSLQNFEICPGSSLFIPTKAWQDYTFTWKRKASLNASNSTAIKVSGGGNTGITVKQAGVYVVEKTSENCATAITEVFEVVMKTDCGSDVATTVSGSCTPKYTHSLPPYTETDPDEECANAHLSYLRNRAGTEYATYKAGLKDDFETKYRAGAMANAVESLVVSYTDQEHHYTLYYYDQAGNLVQTVPPAGIDTLTNIETKAIITAKANDGASPNTSDLAHTDHTLATTYTYNSLNQLVSQNVPDNEAMDILKNGNLSTVAAGQEIAVVEADGMQVWAFANDANNAYQYRSSNSGETYSTGLKLDIGNLLDMHHYDNTYWGVGSKGLLMKSTDAQTWTLIPWINNVTTLKKVYAQSASTLFVMTDGNQIYRSGDAGATWTQMNTINVIHHNNATNSFVAELVDKTISDIKLEDGNLLITANNTSNEGFVYKGTLPLTGTSITLYQYINVLPEGGVFNFNGLNFDYLSGGKVYQISNLNQIAYLIGESYPTTLTAKNFYRTSALSVIQTESNTYWAKTTSATSYTQLTDVSNYTLVLQNDNIGFYNGTASAYKLLDNGTTQAISSNNLTVKGYSRSAGVDYWWATNGGNENLLISNGITYPINESFQNFEVVNGTLILYNNGNPLKSYVKSGNVYVLKSTIPYNDYKELITIGTEKYLITHNGSTIYPVSVATDGTLAVGIGIVPSINPIFGSKRFAFGGNPNQYVYNSYQDETHSVNATSDRIKLPLDAQKINTIAGNYAAGDQGIIYQLQEVNNFKILSTIATNTSADFKKASKNGANLILASSNTTYSLTNNVLASNQSLSSEIISVSGTALLTSSGAVYTNNNTITNSYTQEAVLQDQTFVYKAPTLTLSGGLNAKTYYKTNGGTWQLSSSLKARPIRAVAQRSTNVLTVGDAGQVLLSTNAGVSYQPLASNNTIQNTAVSFVGNTNDFVVGKADGSMVIYTETNGSYTIAPITFAGTRTSATAKIQKMTSNSLSEVWAIQGRDVLKKTGNTQFTLQFSTPEILTDINFSDNYGYLIGQNGTAYRIKPKGISETEDGSSIENTQIIGTYDFAKIKTDANLTDDKGTGLPMLTLLTVSFQDRLVGYLNTSSKILKTIDGGYHWKLADEKNGLKAVAISQNGKVIYANSNQLGVFEDKTQKITSRFWYDELGRLILSQNSKQFNIENHLTEQQYQGMQAIEGAGVVRAYSYTLYDDIGRITEVGEVLTRAVVELLTTKNKSQISYTSHQDFVGTGVKTQISRTYYDRIAFPELEFTDKFKQKNLRPRVASVTYQQFDGDDYGRATHYSYDIHGNVNTMLQEVSSIDHIGGERITKRIDYEYDLISGNVNFVHYQRGHQDAFSHKYIYDGDNRIQKVFTSTDEVIWNEEAKYDYYAHGPLARVTTGGNVDKCDYVYTIHGWIKGTISNNFQYALGYYNSTETIAQSTEILKDYKAIGTPAKTVSATPMTTSLYNGNISTMATKTPAFAQNPIAPLPTDFTKQFTYDQLNRIKTSKVSALLTVNGSQTTVNSLPSTESQFGESYTYDANGNILTLQRRNQAGQLFDDLNYKYHNVNDGYNRNTNQLRYVLDAVSDGNLHPEDIENQGIDNYTYDEIGNLAKDVAEDIYRIEWTVSGKVAAVIRTASSTKADLYFSYDAMGNRISKTVVDKVLGNTKTTYYFRDASGNEMAIYEKTSSSPLKIKEFDIYGSSRLGNYTPLFSSRNYEFSDHLGNVHLVLNDKGEAQSATEYYPFGMVMQTYSPTDYRYGFNGMEKDDEWSGSGNSYDFGARIYDSRLGRWYGLDKSSSRYSGFSPYNFAINCPLIAIDPDGNDVIVIHAPNGANHFGHAALLIGDEEHGWDLYSANGTKFGESSWSGQPDNTHGEHFSTLSDFQKSSYNYYLTHNSPYYFEGLRIVTSDELDVKMAKRAIEFLRSGSYHTFSHSCIDLVHDVLDDSFNNAVSDQVNSEITNYSMSSNRSILGVLFLQQSPTPTYHNIKRAFPKATAINLKMGGKLVKEFDIKASPLIGKLDKLTADNEALSKEISGTYRSIKFLKFAYHFSFSKESRTEISRAISNRTLLIIRDKMKIENNNKDGQKAVEDWYKENK